jgi:hypothetical protein
VLRPSSGRQRRGSLMLLVVHGPRQEADDSPCVGAGTPRNDDNADLEDGRDDTDVLTSYRRRVPLLALYRAARPT